MDVQKELRLACQIEESNAKNQEMPLDKNYPGLSSVAVIVKNIQAKMEHIPHLLA
jgi:hypothetical protein